MRYLLQEDELDELMWLVKQNVDKGQVVYTLCAIREELEDKAAKDYFQAIIDELAEESKCCPKCGLDLVSIMYKEHHDELEGHWCEVGTDGYYCEKCNKGYDY